MRELYDLYRKSDKKYDKGHPNKSHLDSNKKSIESFRLPDCESMVNDIKNGKITPKNYNNITSYCEDDINDALRLL